MGNSLKEENVCKTPEKLYRFGLGSRKSQIKINFGM